jgi:aspartate 1-decarboxylase
MNIEMLYSKIHRATVSDVSLNYTIKGKRASRDMCLNGSAVRKKVEIRDKIIVIAHASSNENEISEHKPVVVHIDDNNISEIKNELLGSEQ